MKTIEILLCGLLFFIIVNPIKIAAQPTAKKGVLLDLHYGYGIPLADLQNRFGSHLGIGIGVSYQPMKNIGQTGIKFTYLFGNEVKEDVIAPFRTSFEGLLIGSDFVLADIRLKERGFIAQIYSGGLIPFPSKIARHGIKWQLGIGMVQHKIRIQDDSRSISQLDSEFNKGLDRLTNGVVIVPFVGYEYLQHKGLISFYVGMEPAVGFTSSKRSYNYDTNSSELNIPRIDMLLNFKVGWYLPFYLDSTDDQIQY